MDNYYSATAYRFNPRQKYNQGHKLRSIIATELLKAPPLGGQPPAWLEYSKRNAIHGGEKGADATPANMTDSDLQNAVMRLDHEILRGVSYGEASWLYAIGTLAYAIGKVGTWMIGIAGFITMFIMFAQGFGAKAVQGYLILLSIPLALWGGAKRLCIWAVTLFLTPCAPTLTSTDVLAW
ncbi:hypothetical protein WH50_25555 [Pokkaliibacter plantistimulans]|uniref:Uncharacterized protein n=1 Tax=Pokkaliibacter plantistimulans TaxID=1635171 RepID=A0ABX5LSJ6_9GAMM|nr:hypothetical protein [Pokkaliibacter plantistimulans]PXF28580.1 hypothetical protein WH50_25555 [Pokkaliibacter plantistimulans]